MLHRPSPATDIATSGRFTTQFSAGTVNEAVMTYTRNKSDTNGVGIPTAESVGMTAVDPLFAHPPEITVLGPMGSFRLFGSDPNDNHFETHTTSWADNLSLVRGKQRLRMGGFFLTQYNGRADTGGARGKITFQTFEDFLLGMSAIENASPTGRSNILSVQANEGVGPNGEVEYRYRRYYGAAFVQDDVKFSPRFTANLGLRWEYIGPSFDETGTIGNISLARMRQAAVPPLVGTLIGNTVAANYDPQLVNPYTGKPFGPAARRRLPFDRQRVSTTTARRSTSSRRESVSPGSRSGTGGRLVVGSAYGWFFQNPTFSANASSAPLFTAVPFAQGFTNADSSNNLSTFAKPFPTTTLGYVPRTPTSQLSDRVAGPEYKIPRLQQWEPHREDRAHSSPDARPRLCRLVWR